MSAVASPSESSSEARSSSVAKKNCIDIFILIPVAIEKKADIVFERKWESSLLPLMTKTQEIERE